MHGLAASAMSRMLTAGISLFLVFGASTLAHAAPGDPVGTEFLVNALTTGRQSDPAVVPDGASGFVVVWESEGTAEDSDGSGIRARRFDAAGTPAGGEFQ